MTILITYIVILAISDISYFLFFPWWKSLIFKKFLVHQLFISLWFLYFILFWPLLIEMLLSNNLTFINILINPYIRVTFIFIILFWLPIFGGYIMKLCYNKMWFILWKYFYFFVIIITIFILPLIYLIALWIVNRITQMF